MKINVKQYVAERKAELIKTIGALDRPPRILIMQIGDNPASNSYIKGKIKDCQEVGISADLFKFNDTAALLSFVSTTDVIKQYEGIILQEPSGLNPTERAYVMERIGKDRDIDGFIADSPFDPCTPKGIMNILLNFYSENLRGETVCIIGRGELVGKPLANMLIEKGATVISCNSKTKNLENLLAESDIVITAAGCRNLLTADMFPANKEVYIIDAGIDFDDEGKICGDCDKELYTHEKIFVTTVPGGVGLTTRVELLENAVIAAHRFKLKEEEDW